MRDFIKGLSYNLIGMQYFFSTRSLWKFVLVPTAINFLALVLLVTLYIMYFGDVCTFLMKPLGGLDVMNPAGFWAHFWDGTLWVIRHFLEIIIFVLALVLVFISVFILSNIINGPFYEAVAEKIIILKGAEPNASLKISSIVRNFFYSLKIELCKTGFFLGMVLVLFLLSWVPVIGPLFTFGIFFFSAWMFAFGLSTYPLVIGRKSFGTILRWGLSHKMLLTGFGLPTLIPIFGLLIIFFQVVGGTLLYFDMEEGQNPKL